MSMSQQSIQFANPNGNAPVTNTTGAAATGGPTTYQWLVAWGVMLVVLGLMNRTQIGHVIIYYSLWLVLVFLLVTQYKFIAVVLAPLGSPTPKGK